MPGKLENSLTAFSSATVSSTAVIGTTTVMGGGSPVSQAASPAATMTSNKSVRIHASRFTADFPCTCFIIRLDKLRDKDQVARDDAALIQDGVILLQDLDRDIKLRRQLF